MSNANARVAYLEQQVATLTRELAEARTKRDEVDAIACACLERAVKAEREATRLRAIETAATAVCTTAVNPYHYIIADRTTFNALAAALAKGGA